MQFKDFDSVPDDDDDDNFYLLSTYHVSSLTSYAQKL